MNFSAGGVQKEEYGKWFMYCLYWFILSKIGWYFKKMKILLNILII